MSEHADHFLSRLDRTSAAETEFALALYRDPELLRSIIDLARPDPAKERVAIALGDDPDGPHVIVTRDARFVTCLGRGMTAYDAALVSRADLEQCGMTVVRLRALMDRATDVTLDRPTVRGAFTALYNDGDRLKREDFDVILRLQPLMLPDLLMSFGVHFDRIQATLRDLSRRDRFRGDEHPRLRATWQGVWAAAHYMTLLASESLALSYRYVAPAHDIEDCFANLASTGIRLGVVPGALRGAWAAGRMAPVCIDAIEATARDEQMTVLRVGAVWALVAAGVRHPSLTERVSRTLEELGSVPSRYVAALAPAALKAMRERLDGGAAWERETVELLRGGTFEPWMRDRWPAFDDDAVLAWHGSLELGIHHEDAMPLLGLLVPWFASREGPMFCQPDAVVRRVQERWDVGASEQLLASYRQMWLPREPKHAAPAPGRNDPCTCGSGKKFKKCCG